MATPRFAQIRLLLQLVEMRGLTPTERTVMLFLVSYCGKDTICFPSRATLATDVGVGTRTIDKTMRTLVERGLVVVHQQRVAGGIKTMNAYELLMPSVMISPDAQNLHNDAQNCANPDAQNLHPKEVTLTNINKERTKEISDNTNWKLIADAWNSEYTNMANSVRPLRSLSDGRKDKIRTRAKNMSMTVEALLMEVIPAAKNAQADFVKNGSWFTFDWIFKNDENLTKLLEGNYASKDHPTQQTFGTMENPY